MQCINEIIVAAAGGGKTTKIVTRALHALEEKSAIITYTQNNVTEITNKLYQLNGAVPPHVEVWSWYAFLLRELARPYQGAMINGRINGIQWVDGRSDRFAKQTDVDRFYFGADKRVYSDKLSRFICECNKASNEEIIKRLEQRFARIYVDEIQDIAGYDIDLIEMMLRSAVKLTLVGDHRQSTFRTNNSARNSGFAGPAIKKKFDEWEKAKLCAVNYERETHRCHQAIANLADSLFPLEPSTISRNSVITGHDGTFCISTQQIPTYIATYRPQILRLDARTDCEGHSAINFGESKGMTFDRVLIFPHQLGTRWLASGESEHVAGSAAKLYVGITRARHSVAFVFDGELKVPGIKRHTE
jgi:DNA helicase-2/ATP-dependent DNA helicase PcrA